MQGAMKALVKAIAQASKSFIPYLTDSPTMNRRQIKLSLPNPGQSGQMT